MTFPPTEVLPKDSTPLDEESKGLLAYFYLVD